MPVGVSVRRHAHHLVFAVEHLEAEVLRHRAVHTRNRIGIVQFLDLVDSSAFAVAEERRRVLAFAVDAENRRAFLETRQVICARCVCEVMLYRHELGLDPVDAERGTHDQHASSVASIAPIAVEERIERAIGRVPVTSRVMPARRRVESDRCVGKRDHVDVARFDAGELQAEPGRVQRHPILRVLVANEAFFFCRRDDFAVDQQRRRRIVIQRSGQSQNDHRGRGVPFAAPAAWRRRGTRCGVRSTRSACGFSVANARVSAARIVALSFQFAMKRSRSRAMPRRKPHVVRGARIASRSIR